MTTYTPDSPRDLGLNESSWWSGQKESIDLILTAFIDDGKKFVMAGIPTGGGKTLIAAAVQTLLGRAKVGEGGSLALTHTIALQKQYVKTLPNAKILVGRRNFDCELPDDHIARFGMPNLKADEAPCAAGPNLCTSKLDNAGGCGYYRQRGAAEAAPMVVTNYAMAPRILQFSDKRGHNPFRRTLLVADECHLAEQAVLAVGGAKCSSSVLVNLGITVPDVLTKTTVMEGRTEKQYETNAVWQVWAEANKDTVASAVTAVGTQIGVLQRNQLGEGQEVGRLKGKLKGYHACLNVMKVMLGMKGDNLNNYSVQRNYNTVEVKPLWGWTQAHDRLWKYFDRVLLMSATPGDPNIERIKLGIPANDFVYIERPSIFPVKNRPIYYLPTAKLNYSSSETDWRRIATVIQQIAEQFPMKKGLIHSGSAKNATRIVSLMHEMFPSKGGRFFTHDKGSGLSREEALEKFTTSEAPLVLVTASFTTGLDLPYIIGWQVIAKVPFGSLGDEVTARRRSFVAADGYKFGQAVYQSEAMNTIVQAAGRIVRSPDDTGPTFILDGNYGMLHGQSYKPKFYTDAYTKVDPSAQ